MQLKKLLLTITLICFGSSANAAWVGKLDLNSSVQPIVMREAHDGQWLAGIAHPNLWRLEHNGNPILHAGLFQAWNAEHGNASFGPIAGLDLLGCSKDAGLDIPATIGNIAEWVGLPSIWRPGHLLTEIITIDAFVGYRPIHTPDVIGEVVYGGAAGLRIPFGVKELQNGNLNSAG